MDSGPNPDDVKVAKELCEDLLSNVREQYQRFKENPPQHNYGGYGQRGDRYHYGGGYGGGYSNHNHHQRQGTPASASPSTQAAPGATATVAAGSPTDYSAQYAQYYGSDPYAAYGGYQNYVAYYQYYQQAAQQMQQQAQQDADQSQGSAPPPPPASEAPPPPPPPGSGSPPPPPGGSYNAVSRNCISYLILRQASQTNPASIGPATTWSLSQPNPYENSLFLTLEILESKGTPHYMRKDVPTKDVQISISPLLLLFFRALSTSFSLRILSFRLRSNLVIIL